MSERSDVEELRPEETEGATRARPSLGGKYEYKQHSANSMPFTVRTHGRAATPSRVGWIRLLFNRTCMIDPHRAQCVTAPRLPTITTTRGRTQRHDPRVNSPMNAMTRGL